MSTKNIFCVLMLAFLLTGCETTGNPREGGIFWSEPKARQRQDALKTEQAAAEGQMNEALSEKSRLKGQHAVKASALEEQQQRLAALDSTVRQMERRLAQKKKLTAAQQREKVKAEKRLRSLRQQVKNTARMKTNTSNASVEAKKRKIDALNKEAEQLLNVISNL